MLKFPPFLATLCIVGLAFPLAAQAPATADSLGLEYSDIADAALPAPIVARAEIDEAVRLREERAVGVPAGHVRYYVEADLLSLIRSAGPVPSRITYLVDVPLLANGKRPDLEDREVLLFAEPVSGRPGSVRLIGPSSQLDWTERREQIVRSLLTEASQPGAPSRITGVANVFSVPGTLPGESETQIFLATDDGRPVSLSVLRRPNQQPRWSVSLSEIVESALPPPQHDTLLWYRLACALPRQLPASAMEAMSPAQIDIARADYALIVRDLGQCGHNAG